MFVVARITNMVMAAVVDITKISSVFFSESISEFTLICFL